MFISSRSLLAFGALLGAAAASSCEHGNNCLRAVIGNAFPTRDGAADCSSFLAVTVSPATYTVTAVQTSTTTTLTTSTTTEPTTVVQTSTSTNVATQTQTRTIRSQAAGVKRFIAVRQQTASATAIPAYASACSGEVKYSSACSCIGVTRYTVTLSTASTTTSTTTGVVQTSVIVTTAASTVTQFTSTTLSVTTTTTSIVLLPPTCNANGLPGANAFNYYADFNTDQTSCKAQCLSDSRCLSTGFYIVTDPETGSQTGTCRRYDKSVADSADLGFGYYNWNDKYCP